MKFRIEVICKMGRGYPARKKPDGIREGFTAASFRILIKLGGDDFITVKCIYTLWSLFFWWNLFHNSDI